MQRGRGEGEEERDEEKGEEDGRETEKTLKEWHLQYPSILFPSLKTFTLILMSGPSPMQ